MQLTIDTVRAIATYTIAAIVVIFGFAIIHDPATAGADKVVVAGFVGSALTFVFSSEVQTRTARQAATFSGNGHATAADKGGV